MKTKRIFKGNNQASLGAVLAVVDLENKPTVVDEFYRGVSIVNRDPVSKRVVPVVALVPSCIPVDVCREIIGCSEGDRDKAVVFWDVEG